MDNEYIFSKKSFNVTDRKHSKERIKRNRFVKGKTIFIKTINYSKDILLIIYLIILSNLIINSISKKQQRRLEFNYSYITLVINKDGTQTFLSSKFQICPDEVYVNGNLTFNDNCRQRDLIKTYNDIKLVFFNELNNTNEIFSGLNSII